MSLELTLLIWSVGLTFVQMLVAVSGATLQFGLPDIAGNRENMPPATSWAGRAQRAHDNMLENLVLFAVLVLVTEVANKNNATTTLINHPASRRAHSNQPFCNALFILFVS